MFCDPPTTLLNLNPSFSCQRAINEIRVVRLTGTSRKSHAILFAKRPLFPGLRMVSKGRERQIRAISIHLDVLEISLVNKTVNTIVVELQHPQLGQLENENPTTTGTFIDSDLA